MTRKTFRLLTTSPEKTEAINPKNKKLIDQFLKEKDTRSSSGTVEGYKSDLSIFFTYVLDNLDNKFFVDIKKLEFAEFFGFCVNELKWGSYRFNRLRICLSSLSQFVERYMDDLYPNFRNVINKAIETMPKVPTREKTILTEKQIDDLLKHLVDNGYKQDACLLALAISSGARISELLRFTTDIIDPDNTAFDGIFIETSKSIKTKGRGKKGDLKYKYIIKDLFMPYYNDWIIERQKIMEDHRQNHNNIFIKQNGEPAQITTINGWLPRWEEFLGVSIYFHAFRHYFVTQLTRIGLSSDLIIEIVGWKSVEMYKTYNDLTGKDRKWADLDKLKDHLNKE